MASTIEMTPEEKIVLFRVHNTYFGVKVEQVVEVTQPDEITKIPKAPVSVAGIIDFRGQIIPVIDLAARLNLPKTENENTYVIVTNVIGSAVGVAVDYVESVLNIEKNKIRDASEIKGVNLGNVDFLKGIVTIDVGLVLLIDFSTLLTKDEIMDLSSIVGNIKQQEPTKTTQTSTDDFDMDLSQLTKAELMKFAKELGLAVTQSMKKDEIEKLVREAMGA